MIKLKRFVAYVSVSCVLCVLFIVPMFTYVAISGGSRHRAKLINRFKRPIISESDNNLVGEMGEVERPAPLRDRDEPRGETQWKREVIADRDIIILINPGGTRFGTEVDFDVDKLQHVRIRENTVDANDLVFTLNHPEKCMRDGRIETVDLLILVASRVSGHEQRSLIRKTWGNTNFYDGRHVVVLFLVGNPKYTQHEHFHRIVLEDVRYNDIVAGNFEDSYNRLTLKTILGLKWAKKYCPLAKYVMKCDDDVLLQPHNVMRYVHRGNIPTRGAFVGACSNNSRAAPSNVHTGLAGDFWPYATYPAYCSGTAYMISGDLVPRLFDCALETSVHRYEDVFMGILAYKLGIPMLRHTAFRPSLMPEDPCLIRDIVVSHHYSNMGDAATRITTEKYGALVSKLWWELQLLRKGYSACSRNVSGLGDKPGHAIYDEEIVEIQNQVTFEL